MKPTLSALMLFATTLAFPTVSIAYDESKVRTIQDLYSDCKSADAMIAATCVRYLQGAAATMLVATYELSDTKVSLSDRQALIPIALCNTDAVSGLQLKQAFINWAEANPKDWQHDEGAGAWIALQKTWPCPMPRR